MHKFYDSECSHLSLSLSLSLSLWWRLFNTFHRCLYMSIVIGFLLVSGGLLTAFLYPRNVDISIVSINSSGDYVTINDLTGLEDSDYAYLEIEVNISDRIMLFFSTLSFPDIS